ncbi:hypothetical protein N4G58_00980 [Edwardsiella piscicida]|nr:hypothetical protein N4G58_00980 [Edwardsiella piscicida]
MALGPIDMAGGMSPQAHGGGQLSAELLDARIERLLQVLNRGDLTPAQRENTLRALTALQRERTLLQAFSQSEPSSATAAGRESPLTSAQRGAAAMATASTGQPVSRVTLGSTAACYRRWLTSNGRWRSKKGPISCFRPWVNRRCRPIRCAHRWKTR